LLPQQGRIWQPEDLVHLLAGMVYADATTSPGGPEHSIKLLNNRRLAMRSCSQLVTTLKAASQPLAAGVMNFTAAGCRMQLECAAAGAGPTLHLWARGKGRWHQVQLRFGMLW
jgi:hypothetical protein